MAKLCQIVAKVQGMKPRVKDAWTAVYHKLQKPDIYSGMTKTYQPYADGVGESLPTETKNVQSVVSEDIATVRRIVAEMLDVVATQDNTNCEAKANISIDGNVIVSDVPVTHLLYLDDVLTNIRTFVEKLPVLDPAEKWSFDEAANLWRSEASEKVRTKKEPRVVVKAAATVQHPAQTEIFPEDRPVGVYREIRFSGAIPAKEKADMLQRVNSLMDAVAAAREEANTIQVKDLKVGTSLLKYVFGDTAV